MNASSWFRFRMHPVLSALAVTCTVLGCVASESAAQAQFLEFRYEFDTTEAPLFDSTGQHANLSLLTNGPEHRLGEESLIGGDGFSLGLDAPGDGHPTGSFLLLGDAPQPETFSYSVWFRPLLTGTNEAILARDNVWWPSPCNFYCMYIDQFQSLVWKTGATETLVSDEGIIQEDETYHVVVTYSDSDGPDTGRADRSRLYLNGELVGEVDNPTEIPSLDSLVDPNGIFEVLWVGTLSSFGGFWGEMDDLQLYRAELSPEQVARMYANPGSLADFGGIDGDFDGSGDLDLPDVNLLSMTIEDGMNDGRFDLNGDMAVDDEDLRIWVKDLKRTWFGDANLDGEFNSQDFVAIFQAGLFEQDTNAGWAQGDWNADNRFNSGDFILAFQDGGFERGPRQAVRAVPELSGISLTAIALAVLSPLYCRRRRIAHGA